MPEVENRGAGAGTGPGAGGSAAGVNGLTGLSGGERADGWVPPAVSAARTRRFGALYMASYLIRNMRRYGVVLVAYSVGQPLIYLVAMGLGLGSLVSGNAAALPGGVPYLVFLAPAILISTSVMVAATETTFPVMAGFKWQRTFYAPHATALSSAQIAQGVMLAVCTRVLFGSVVFWVFMLLFRTTDRVAESLLVIPISLLSALAFGLPVMAYAASITEDRGQFATVQRFIIMPLFLFSGTFYPLAVLPGYLQWIGWLSPIWHGTELARVVSFSYAEPGWLTVVHVLFLAALALVGYLLSVRNFRKRLDA